jgi:hypothetical protein
MSIAQELRLQRAE